MKNQTYYKDNLIQQTNAVNISRLDFIKRFSLGLGVIMTSCTPVKILLNAHEDKFDDDATLKIKILTAFVTAVIPGIDPNDPDLCRIFCDEYYLFHKYNGFFISDLFDKSEKLFGTENFYDLTLDERTQVIQAGLDDDSTTERIYTAAIFIAQVSSYCSIYNDEKGCSLIDYQGSYGFMDSEMFYPNPNKYMAHEFTSTGNYA